VRLFDNQYLRIINELQPETSRIVCGPALYIRASAYESVEGPFNCPILLQNQYMVVQNEAIPGESHVVHGPCMYIPKSPYEKLQSVLQCPVLDSDDYLVVVGANGDKRTLRGPMVFQPEFLETWSRVENAIVVPVNHYIRVEDNNSTTEPFLHLRGPLKFIPEPYQRLIANPDRLPAASAASSSAAKQQQQQQQQQYDTSVYVHPCVEINSITAIHLLRTDGRIDLLQEPGFYMPRVGERVLKQVQKIVLLETDFCIMKAPDGHIHFMHGKNPDDRAFFPQPNFEFLEFNAGENAVMRRILSSLPTLIHHDFQIRTKDSVIMVLSLRISYQIYDPSVFQSLPIDYYKHIVTWSQNELLDAYAKVTLREFMLKYSDVAFEAVSASKRFFDQYGINILDIQIINYHCFDGETQKLLGQDIETNVRKHNEIKAKEADVAIAERENEIEKRRRELAVELTKKDIEMELLRKDMSVRVDKKTIDIEFQRKEAEIAMRLKELDLQVAEEKKKGDLLALKALNIAKEGEAEGGSEGASIAAFLRAFPEGISMDQRLEAWNRLRNLDRDVMIYSKVDRLQIVPPDTDLKIMSFVSDRDRDEAETTARRIAPIPRILQHNADVVVASSSASSKKK
jgi:hypothetical protein